METYDRQNMALQQIVQQQQQSVMALTLPQPTIKPFKGDPIEYCDFIRSFEHPQWRRGSHVFWGGGGGQVHHFSDKQIFCDITNSVVRKCSFDCLLRWFPPNLFAAFLSNRQFADGTNKTKHISKKHRKVRKGEVGAETGFS